VTLRRRVSTQIEAEVFAAVDHMCLRVGALLAEARDLDPGGFKAWVEAKMPFGYDKARRLVAIHLAYRELPAEVQARLPRPWQALYALRHWSGGRLTEAIESGEIDEHTTVVAARERARAWSSDRRETPELSARYSAADLAAGRLMTFSPADVNSDVRRALERWLGVAPAR
jgi:hypothetical protein